MTGKHREVGSLMHRSSHSTDRLQLCDYLLAQSRAGNCSLFAAGRSQFICVRYAARVKLLRTYRADEAV